jgi:hypothetical protein
MFGLSRDSRQPKHTTKPKSLKPQTLKPAGGELPVPNPPDVDVDEVEIRIEADAADLE